MDPLEEYFEALRAWDVEVVHAEKERLRDVVLDVMKTIEMPPLVRQVCPSTWAIFPEDPPCPA